MTDAACVLLDGSDCGANARSTFGRCGADGQELHVQDSQRIYWSDTRTHTCTIFTE